MTFTYLEGEKLVEIASQLNLPEGTVRRWKCTHKWDNERSDKKNERSRKRKRGAQPKNQNAVGNNGGAPEQNKNAEKFGFFSKYLPEETVSIIQEMPTDPLDVLWDQIQIAYAAIIRAQQIMYVRDRDDKTIEKIEEKDGNVIGERWEVQQAGTSSLPRWSIHLSAAVWRRCKSRGTRWSCWTSCRTARWTSLT